jgi:sensor histidine kinase YesM
MMRYREILLKHKVHHVILWLLFFAGWYFMRIEDFPDEAVAAKITLVKVAVLAILVYITNYLLIPTLLYKKKYLLFAGTVILLVSLFGILKIYLIMQLLQPYYSRPLLVFDQFKERIYDNLIPLFLLVSTGAALKFIMVYLLAEKRLATISKEKAEAELQYLRSQVNPHFVFNTLNSIYFQIEKTNIEARQTLLQFSDLLRYQLYECNADTIPVEKEMNYLRDYVRLQEKRKDEHYQVQWCCSPTVKNFQIVPLLIMPLVENAFKHISHHEQKSNTISIEADKKEHNFCIKISNTVEEGGVTTELKYGGIGLKNVRRRLELLYPGKHRLDITCENGLHSVNLQLTIE